MQQRALLVAALHFRTQFRVLLASCWFTVRPVGQDRIQAGSASPRSSGNLLNSLMEPPPPALILMSEH
jgi:hypothetical protein